jgi:hypothetical protein
MSNGIEQAQVAVPEIDSHARAIEPFAVARRALAVGLGAMAFAGGGLAAEANAEYLRTPATSDPAAAAAGRLHKLEAKWNKDCQKNPDAMHMALIGPALTQVETPVMYSVAAFSCRSVRQAKLALLGGRPASRWNHSMRARKVYTRDMEVAFNKAVDLSDPDLRAYGMAVKATAKGHPGYYENLRLPFAR